MRLPEVILFSLLLCGSISSSAFAEIQNSTGSPDRKFFQQHCVDCHEGADAEGGLDFSKLSFDLSVPGSEQRWVSIYDRIQTGEMPPPDSGKLPGEATQPLLESLSHWIVRHQQQRQATEGRIQGRKLTQRELERTLQDLLGIDIPLLQYFPEESKAAEFSTMPSGQSISHFDVERHLAVVDIALDEAFRRALEPQSPYRRHFAVKDIIRKNPKARNREPELREGKAVIWSSGLIYYGRTPVTIAPQDGWYRFQVKIAGLRLPSTGGVWTTVYTGLCVSSAPILNWVTAFEVTEEPKVVEFEAWIPKGHMLEIRPGDITLKKAGFAGGQVGAGEGEPQNVPGIAMDWIKMERIHRGPDDKEIRRRLFNDLPIGSGRNSEHGNPTEKTGPVSDTITEDQMDQLMVSFASRAFRRPVVKEDIHSYCEQVRAALSKQQDPVSALRLGYRALLCSPRFLYLTEPSGELDSFSLASRLSYMLTGSLPDKDLFNLAVEDKLRNPAIIHQQVERLLSGAGGRRFVEDFAEEWLDLNEIEFTEPDRSLVPDFDKIVQHAMLDETRTFLDTMLQENASVRRLIDADETFLNSRLARYYGIPGIKGDELRRVTLLPEMHRAGLMTQGAILKVTANGSETSPVVRGVWVAERILGEPIPPPPENIPAVEPDIRGSKTIRELLEKHRADPSCARCHVKIDPPGFALENYDPGGKWRERYPGPSKRQQGPVIDASSVLTDGRTFQNLSEFQALVATRPEALARNLAEKLIAFGTGAPVSFVDREEVERIVTQVAKEDYGFRSIVHAVTTSPLFLQK
ncbi:MAG TPA: DUF1592 domain-containing protein [Planctomicrobium sp.]|nr:DUF1592 domain-containing protein [Planctomicrobium sp.]